MTERHWIAIGTLVLLTGCDRIAPVDQELTIVSPWSVKECQELERDFNGWRTNAGRGSVEFHWIWLAPGDDLQRVVMRRGTRAKIAPALDIALGGPASAYRRLAAAGILRGVPGESLAWWSVRRSPIGIAVDSHSSWPKELGPRLAFDDPRRDAVALAWAVSKLSAGAWGEGYAELVRDARESRRVGRQTGSALAAVERREVDRALTTESRASLASVRSFAAENEAGEFAEGAAVAPGGSQPKLADEFFQFLRERGDAKISLEDPKDASAAEYLLADLLGATLVDAQDELWVANAALVRAGCPTQLERFLAEAPPWPPASVDELVKKGRDDLLETLAGQITPDADVRVWLRRSWLVPARVVDGTLLDEMAGAVDGRLVREPRFRAWLRAEWTAWARQRYRRVARVAQGRLP